MNWPTAGSQSAGVCVAGGANPAPRAGHGWPTPMQVNTTSGKAKFGRATAGPSRGGASYGLEDLVGEYLAAVWAEALMGWPVGWTELK